MLGSITRRCLLVASLVALVLTTTASGVLAASSLDDGVKRLSSAITPQVRKLGGKRVAVVDFSDLQGRVTELGRFVAEELSASLALAGGGIRVVDRQHLARIIQEQKLAIYGVTDPRAVKRLGQLAGADVLVVGSVTDLGDQVRITAKILSAATADIVGAGQTSVPKDSVVERLLGRGVAQPRQDQQTPAGAGLPFRDTFDIRPNPAWRVVSGRWVVKDGAYTVPEGFSAGTESIALVGGPNWVDYLVEVDVEHGVETFGSPGNDAAILLRVQDRSNFVRLRIKGWAGNFLEISWIVRENGADIGPIGAAELRARPQRIHVRIQVKGENFFAAVDGVSTSFSFAKWSRGQVGLMVRAHWPRFDNFTVSPVLP